MSKELIVAIIGFGTGILGLIAAFIGRKKQITTRQEVVNRQETVHIQKTAEPEFVARCHDCGRGIRDGDVVRKNVKTGSSRQWRRGFLGIGGRWEVVNQYATVDLCTSCSETRTTWFLLGIIAVVLLFVLILAKK